MRPDPETVIVAKALAATVGENVTEIWHDAFTARAPLHVLEKENCAACGPVSDAAKLNEAEPPLVTVRTWVIGEPICRVPKARKAGENAIELKTVIVAVVVAVVALAGMDAHANSHPSAKSKARYFIAMPHFRIYIKIDAPLATVTEHGNHATYPQGRGSPGNAVDWRPDERPRITRYRTGGAAAPIMDDEQQSAGTACLKSALQKRPSTSKS